MRRALLLGVLALLVAGTATANAATIKGTPRNDHLRGTKKPDRIFSGKGRDIIRARNGGKDLIWCGPGRDVVVIDKRDIARGCERKVMPPPPNPPPGPSGEAAPQGDLPGWRQIFLDDFTVDVNSWGDCSTFDGGRTCPSLPEPYRSKWWAYPNSYQDTAEKVSGNGGFYRPSNLSMTSGLLKLPLRRSGGTSQSAAPVPKIPGAAQTYGRYAIRFRTTSSDAFKIAWLLWRTTATWGEIDFPEGDLDGNVCAFNHGVNGGNAFARCGSTPVAGAWHTAVTEWTPGRIKFFLDGALLGETTSEIPSTPMTWVIQSETVLGGSPPAEASADIYIDWVAIWSYSPNPSPPPPPVPGGGQDFGLVANSDHGNAIIGTGKVGGNLLRAEFDAGQRLASIQSVIDQAEAINVEVIPQISSPWGTAGTVAAWAHGLDGIRFIEFGNEDSFSYKGTQNQGGVYGAEAARAIQGMAGSGVGLLVQGDDANTGSQWPLHVKNALNGAVPAGWVIHPYGPGWRERIARNVAMLPFGAPLYITEWGVSSDNGACLNDNYGFDRCLTYAEAGDTIRSNVEQMFSSFPQIRALFLFQVKDQQGSGTGEREHFFGALRSDLSDKPGLTDDVRFLASSY